MSNPVLFKRGNKYRAKRTNGFASKKEAAKADELTMLKNAGQVRWFTKQFPIHLTGGIRYVADFLVCMADGRMRIIETKGFSTEAWRLKLRLLEADQPELFKILEVV